MYVVDKCLFPRVSFLDAILEKDKTQVDIIIIIISAYFLQEVDRRIFPRGKLFVRKEFLLFGLKIKNVVKSVRFQWKLRQLQ